jgi:hypothetical protein
MNSGIFICKLTKTVSHIISNVYKLDIDLKLFTFWRKRKAKNAVHEVKVCNLILNSTVYKKELSYLQFVSMAFKMPDYSQ